MFTVKHSSIWLLPLITASISDTVVQHQPVERLWLSTGIILLILLVNYPLHLLCVRLLYGCARRMGAVRDVETVEQMVQQTAENGLRAITVLLGELVIIAVRTPEFVPLFLVVVPAATLVVARLRARLRTPNEHFRHEVESLSSRKAPSPHGRHPAQPADLRHAPRPRQRPVRVAGLGRPQRGRRARPGRPSRVSGTRTTTAAGPPYATSPSP